MIKTYRTISSPSEGSFRDRGSKFLAFAYPVNNEVAIKDILEELRKKYHDARHHCYAWKTGIRDINQRANDDGEPSSSAGKPILNQIEKARLTNVLIVVIRYFGGTLLGVGGLINAYRSAAKDAIENARVITVTIKHTYLIRFEYPRMNDVMTVVKELQLETFDQVFELSCSMKVRTDLEREKVFLEKIKAWEDCTVERTPDE